LKFINCLHRKQWIWNFISISRLRFGRVESTNIFSRRSLCFYLKNNEYFLTVRSNSLAINCKGNKYKYIVVRRLIFTKRHISPVGADAIFSSFFLMRHHNASYEHQYNYTCGRDENPNLAIAYTANSLKL